MVIHEIINVPTQKRAHWVDITGAVQRVVAKSGITNGFCLVASLHTTGGITINENADPDVERDFFWKLAEMVPQERAFHHGEGNSDAHILTSLVGLSVQIPVVHGTIERGRWQSVYFCEFDGPRNREVSVTVIGE